MNFQIHLTSLRIFDDNSRVKERLLNLKTLIIE